MTPDFSNQNLRQIGPRVPELWSDKHTDRDYNLIDAINRESAHKTVVSFLDSYFNLLFIITYSIYFVYEGQKFT